MLYANITRHSQRITILALELKHEALQDTAATKVLTRQHFKPVRQNDNTPKLLQSISHSMYRTVFAMLQQTRILEDLVFFAQWLSRGMFCAILWNLVARLNTIPSLSGPVSRRKRS
jgi:hypothetical protein